MELSMKAIWKPTANFGETGRLFGMKTAGFSGQTGHPLAVPD